MLGIIRDKATGWIAGVIVGALIISFAFWGVSFYFGQGREVNVASVNGTDISYQTFQRSFYNLRQQMQSIIDDVLTLEEDELVKQQTLQKLVDAELLNQMVQANNFRIPNEKVVQTIMDLDIFKGENGFDRVKYERAIMNLGMDPVYFEAQLRMDLLSEQLQAGLSETLFVLDAELEKIIGIKTQTRDLTYTILEVDNFRDAMEVTDPEIEDFYKNNAALYQYPEQIDIAYIDLDVNKLAALIGSDEEALRAYYQDNKDKYDVVEQRSVTKLFVNTTDDAGESLDETTREKAREALEAALALARQDKAFEEIIEQFTEEGKGALEFSEHAFMAKGIMGDEIDAFLFEQEEGAVSDIIKTDKGLNIVKVGEIRGGPKNVYENSAEQVEQDYKKSQAELEFFELSDQLATLSYEHPDSLEIAAEAINLQVEKSGFFSRDQGPEGILRNAKVIEAAFNPELISAGINSDVIEAGENHIVVMRVLAHREASTQPLTEVQAQVVADIKQKKAEEKVQAIGKSMVDELKAGTPVENLNAEVEVDWSSHEKITRDDININRSVVRYAFEAVRPAENGRTITSHRLGSGDYAVLVLTGIHAGEPDDAELEKIEKTTDLELRRTRGIREWQEFLQNVREDADVTIYEDNT